MEPILKTSGPPTRIRSETSPGSSDKDTKVIPTKKTDAGYIRRQGKGSREVVSERLTVLHTRFCSLSNFS